MNSADYDIDWDAQTQLQANVDNLTFGKILRAHRQCEDWTLAMAAEKLKVSKQLLSAYERGIKLPSIRKAADIATVLGFVPEMAVLSVINEQLANEHFPYRVHLAS